MITKIQLMDFKGFQNSKLEVGPFTVIIGANGSGKSNIRDAFRFLHGIGREYTIPEIIGGKYGAGGQSEWSQMRGAANEIVRFGETSFLIYVNFRLNKRSGSYKIQVERSERHRGGFVVVSEALSYGLSTIYDTHPGGDDPVNTQDDENHLLLRMAKSGNQRRLGARIAARLDQPALTQIGDFKQATRYHKDIIQGVINQFSSIRFLDLVPELMRKPAFPGQNILGDNGENLPTVLQGICSSLDRKNILISWLTELTPVDVVDFDFVTDPTTGLVQFRMIESNGNSISAYSASDGTLRFLAMLAALLGENPAGLYFFEEIDNGIHPARLKLLLDLIERQTSSKNIQVVTTTHSPDLLSMIGDDTFKYTSIVHRVAQEGYSEISSVRSIPDVGDTKTEQGLGKLHASGWLEDVLAFSSGQ